MRKLVTITDLTRMSGKYVCAAGYLQNRTCIRPVSRYRPFRDDWLQSDGQVVIRPFAIVEFDFWRRNPQPPHTEDWIVHPSYRVFQGMLAPSQQEALLSRVNDGSVENIFGATICSDHGWYIKVGEGKRSLGTVSPKQVWLVSFDEKWGSYRIAFTDEAEQWYRLTVTDLSFREYAKYLCTHKGTSPNEVAKNLTKTLQAQPIFLRIGLARNWKEFPEQCHLQITGVYTFPDYLEGHCFANSTL